MTIASGTGRLVSPQHPINWRHPQNQGLVAWWMDAPGSPQGAPTLRTLVGPWHGQLTAMASPPTAASGRGTTARRGGTSEVRFEGVDDYAIVNASNEAFAFADTTFFVAAWVRSTSFATQQYVVAEQDATAFAGGWVLRLETTALAHARLVDSSGNGVARRTSVSPLTVGTWTHLLAVFTTNTSTQAGNAVTLYVNGLPDQGAQVDGSNPYGLPTVDLHLGIQSGGLSALSGAMDDVRIWQRRAPTDAEVLAIYTQSLLGYPDVLNWAPSRLVGTTAAAAFGLGRSSVLTGRRYV